MENNQSESLLEMHVDYDGGQILQETVRWSRFLSIVGFIALAICVLVFAVAGSVVASLFSTVLPGIEGLEGALFLVVILAMVATFAFAVYMLYRFSTLTRKAIAGQDQTLFSVGMKCLKLYFLVSGVLAILSLLGNLFSLTKLFNS